MKYMITMYVVNPHESEDGVRILPESSMTQECTDDQTIFEATCKFLLSRPCYWAVSVLKQGEHENAWHAIAYIRNPAYDPAEQVRRFKTQVKVLNMNVKH